MSPEGKRCYETFIHKVRKSIAEAEATSLTVLVWGPGPGAGGDMFAKRKQIRGMLRERYHDAAVFSEDVDKDCRQFSASSRVNELFQALHADFIIALYSSPGSIAEVHDMAKALGSKMLIFVDSRHTQGYGFTGLLSDLKSKYDNVETFEYPADVHECHLMAAIEKKLKPLRRTKWLANKGVHL